MSLFRGTAQWLAVWVLLVSIGGAPGAASAQYGRAPEGLDCHTMPCSDALPGAVRFEREGEQPFVTGYAADGSRVGWLGLSNELVDVVAYSGHPVIVLVGLSPEGRIAGARLIHHSEPILLTGIPESELVQFIAYYPGHLAAERIVVGGAAREGEVAQVTHTGSETGSETTTFGAVDVISGATVTALAVNRTILDSARLMGTNVGVVSVNERLPGRFVANGDAWSWQRLVDEGVFGRLTVTEREMGLSSEGTFIDLWFTLADAPSIGRALIPRGDYEHLMGRLEPDQHLLVVLGNGSSSFKGSGFVRGGVFDRVRVDQGLTEIQFRDVDYTNLGRLPAVGAPSFREGAIFITRDGVLDPGAPFDLVFLGSRHQGSHAFDREFRSFEAAHRLPRSVYEVDEPPAELSVWEAAWQNHRVDVIVLGAWLSIITLIFALRRYTFRRLAVVKRLHLSSMLVSFVLVGVHLRSQPSVTQMLTLIGTLVAPLRGETMRSEVFLTEPLLFLLWIFIAVTSLVFGRGVFCGWVCPYGVMTELAHKVGKALKLPQKELPAHLHRRLRFVRYGVLVALAIVFLVSPVVGEQAAEIEPFKSTFLVPFWTRGLGFIAWWVLLLAVSTVSWRPFCRYLCPMGAGLALFNSFRLAGPKRRRSCSHCKICQRGCEPAAIADDGSIDPRECLSCMECEATYHEESICPPLVGIDRLLKKKNRTSHDEDKLAQLRRDEEPVGWHAPRK
ncbi:MAG: 4Fe-4S binding protein [Sandaracinaceae bacterium]|nr:4Fe-4S binding protein [Sandaracinaceae bacterium]